MGDEVAAAGCEPVRGPSLGRIGRVGDAGAPSHEVNDPAFGDIPARPTVPGRPPTQVGFFVIEKIIFVQKADGLQNRRPDHQARTGKPVEACRLVGKRRRHDPSLQKPGYDADLQRGLEFAGDRMKAKRGFLPRPVRMLQPASDKARLRSLFQERQKWAQGAGPHDCVRVQKPDEAGRELCRECFADGRVVAVAEPAVARQVQNLGPPGPAVGRDRACDLGAGSIGGGIVRHDGVSAWKRRELRLKGAQAVEREIGRAVVDQHDDQRGRRGAVRCRCGGHGITCGG